MESTIKLRSTWVEEKNELYYNLTDILNHLNQFLPNSHIEWSNFKSIVEMNHNIDISNYVITFEGNYHINTITSILLFTTQSKNTTEKNYEEINQFLQALIVHTMKESKDKNKDAKKEVVEEQQPLSDFNKSLLKMLKSKKK